MRNWNSCVRNVKCEMWNVNEDNIDERYKVHEIGYQ